MEIQPLHPLVVQLFAIAANVATCCGMFVAIAGVGVAIWAGYKTYTVWKEQAKHELAREVLKSVYNLRDKIRFLIVPGYSVREMETWDLEKAFRVQPEVNNQEYEIIIRGEALRGRWPAVQEALSELDLASIEAEILFGVEVREKIEEVKRTIRWYGTTIDSYHHFVGEKDFDKAIDIGKMIFGPKPSWDEIKSGPSHDRWTEIGSAFYLRLQQTIDKVAEALTPYLKKK